MAKSKKQLTVTVDDHSSPEQQPVVYNPTKLFADQLPKSIPVDPRDVNWTAVPNETGYSRTSGYSAPSVGMSVVHTVPLATLEAAVQITALLINRDGKEPSGAYLLQKCGQKHVNAVKDAGVDPEEVAAWARAEARRRSPALDHLVIVAKRLET